MLLTMVAPQAHAVQLFVRALAALLIDIDVDALIHPPESEMTPQCAILLLNIMGIGLPIKELQSLSN